MPTQFVRDIILLDLNMPRMNGHELLARIKADDVLKSIPVIVLSSSTASGRYFQSLRIECKLLCQEIETRLLRLSL